MGAGYATIDSVCIDPCTHRNRPSGGGVMAPSTERREIERLLKIADVTIDGTRDWDIQVHDEAFFARVLRAGSRGFGQAYVDGWWDCAQLDELFRRLLAARLDSAIHSVRMLLAGLHARLFNLQKPSRAFTIGSHHYDLGNDLYRVMLDRRMIYSSGYWANATSLDAAQEAKLDLVCRKLQLGPGMRVLDIGCGWGGAAKFAAERYGAEVVGITVSRQQVELAEQICRGLPVEIRYQDYRQLNEPFDRIFSLGMIEHVGYKNYRRFMRVVRRCLRDDGRFLLHTIGGNRSCRRGDPWVEKYIFPNSMLPSAKQISTAAEGIFLLDDWHCFGADYDRTLLQWHRNFEAGWDELRDRYDERFHRMWRYYLLQAAGSFRARKNHVWQIVLSPPQAPADYRARV